MGYSELEFIKAYYDNIGKQNIEAIENHPLGQSVAKFYDEEIDGRSNVWEGQPAELLEHLEIIAQIHRINTNHKLWPKEVRWLTRRLNQIRSNLQEGLGIDITIDRLNRSDRKDVISAIKKYKDKRREKPVKILVIHFPTYFDYSSYSIDLRKAYLLISMSMSIIKL